MWITKNGQTLRLKNQNSHISPRLVYTDQTWMAGESTIETWMASWIVIWNYRSISLKQTFLEAGAFVPWHVLVIGLCYSETFYQNGFLRLFRNACVRYIHFYCINHKPWFAQLGGHIPEKWYIVMAAKMAPHFSELIHCAIWGLFRG